MQLQNRASVPKQEKELGQDTKIFRMHRLGIPQERFAKRLGLNQASIHNHLLKMATLPNLINSDLYRGFTVAEVAEKHACPVGPEDRTGGWTGPMAWSLVLEGGKHLERFKEVVWKLRLSQ